MTVIAYSGNAGDHTIGLIACSRHQSGNYFPWAQHKPRMDFVVAVNGGPAIDYLRRELGYEATRYSRTYFKFWESEQWTGHTALFMRRGGQAAFAQGWVPVKAVTNYAYALVAGGEVPGEWQDDLQMIDDTTCVSLEFPVTQGQADGLVDYWTDIARGNFNTYCYSVLGQGRCNCVWASSTALRDYARRSGIPAIENAMAKITSPAQGRLMAQIMGGELLL
jgi:hypothetical protein